ncbi:MAG: thiamine diphosphokinase [Actinomycetota bacterium]
MPLRRALIVAAADPSQLATIAERPEHVIAADSGVHAILQRGWTPDHVVGDLDSADPSAITRAHARGAAIERAAVDKDETDLELAIGLAQQAGLDEIHVVVRDGGRLDHQIANLMVLASPKFADTRLSATVGLHDVWVVRGHRQLALEPGRHLALLPVGGPAQVTSAGVAFPLHDEELSPFAGRGIANQVTSNPVELDISAGVVLVVSSPTQTNDPAAVQD